MTTSAPTQPADPHQSKIAPDDPRLRLGRERGRTLRAGPILGLLIAVLGVVAVALVIALQPAAPAGHAAQKSDPEPPPGPLQPPAIPDAIRNAQAAPVGPTPAAPEPLAFASLADAGPLRGGPMPSGPPGRGGQIRAQRDEQTLKAEGAGILFEAHAPESPPTAAAPAAGPSSTSPGQAAGQRLAQGPGDYPAAAAAATENDPNQQDRKNTFVDSKGATKTTDTLVATVQHPASPYELQAGSIIPAVLITAINSDLPGPVIGQVRENVYDSVSGNTLLVPQGSRLLASYDSMVVWGQERVLMCWNRLIFPNGDSITLQCMPAADLAGAAGLTDSVDEHWWRILSGAAVASLLAATAQGVAGNTNAQGYTPTVPQMWAQNSAASVNQAGQQITRRNMDIQPTITVRPGWALNVVVTKDMVLAPYTAASSPSPLSR
jgi:type IV secretion system protein VirB10